MINHLGLPLPPGTTNIHFVEARLLLSLRFVSVWTATERTGPPSPGTSVPAEVSSWLYSACQQGSSSRAAEPSLNTRARGGGAADGSDTCWPAGFLLRVWSCAVSSPCFHWKLRGDFPMGQWHRNSLCASVHWPDEPWWTWWQTWWTLQKLPKREMVADLEPLTWSKPRATQRLLLFSWLPQIAAPTWECCSGFCFYLFYERCTDKERATEKEKKRRGERERVTSYTSSRWQIPKPRLLLGGVNPACTS